MLKILLIPVSSLRGKLARIVGGEWVFLRVRCEKATQAAPSRTLITMVTSCRKGKNALVGCLSCWVNAMMQLVIVVNCAWPLLEPCTMRRVQFTSNRNACIYSAWSVLVFCFWIHYMVGDGLVDAY